MLKLSIIASIVSVVMAIPAWAESQNSGEIFRAMRDEMQRATVSLTTDEAEPPYFIAYKIDDSVRQSVTATRGSLLTENVAHFRLLSIELRIGDYQFDSTNFYSGLGSSGGIRVTVPISVDDNYAGIRHQLWLATDELYKAALKNYAEKKAINATSGNSDLLPDFTRESVHNIEDIHAPIDITIGDLKKIAMGVSNSIANVDKLDSSQVDLQLIHKTTYFLNSEGTSYTRTQPALHYFATAGIQADDGRVLQDFDSLHLRNKNDLPSTKILSERLNTLSKRLINLTQAPLLESAYVGPVLFEDQAAAELVLQTLAPNLIAPRISLIANPIIRRRQQGNLTRSFSARLNNRILPRAFTIIDNPHLDRVDDIPLFANYRVDDEGVASREHTLVEQGQFAKLLGTRIPGLGHEKSTGSMRGGIPTPSNLLLTSTDTVTAEALRNELLTLIKSQNRDYGLIVRRLSNPRFDPVQSQSTTNLFAQQQIVVGSPISVYKLFANGKEELVRNTEIQNFDMGVYRDILLAGDRPIAYSAPFSLNANQMVSQRYAVTRQLSELSIASVVTPSLLFEEMSIATQLKEPEPLPDYPAP